MNKYLTKFNTELEYNEKKGTLVLPNVSLITSTDEVKYAAKPKHFLDFLHSNGTINNTPADDVIGICVIPESHYGKARFMSVVNMSANSTSGTTSDEYLKWKDDNDGTTDLAKQYTLFNGMDLYNDSTAIVEYDYADGPYPCLPRDVEYDDSNQEVTIPSNWDQNAVWFINDDDPEEKFVQSPFLANGTKNPFYGFNSDDVLSDINGAKNTADLLAKSATNYPAALACASFAPGFKDGKWYLPAIGELGYLQVRYGAINEKLGLLEDEGYSVAYLPSGSGLWSSSECSASNAWYLYAGDGFVYGHSKDDCRLVRAFLAL